MTLWSIATLTDEKRNTNKIIQSITHSLSHSLTNPFSHSLPPFTHSFASPPSLLSSLPLSLPLHPPPPPVDVNQTLRTSRIPQHGLEFGGEVFFTNSLMPQPLTSLHSALCREGTEAGAPGLHLTGKIIIYEALYSNLKCCEINLKVPCLFGLHNYRSLVRIYNWIQ